MTDSFTAELDTSPLEDTGVKSVCTPTLEEIAERLDDITTRYEAKQITLCNKSDQEQEDGLADIVIDLQETERSLVAQEKEIGLELNEMRQKELKEAFDGFFDDLKAEGFLPEDIFLFLNKYRSESDLAPSLAQEA